MAEAVRKTRSATQGARTAEDASAESKSPIDLAPIEIERSESSYRIHTSTGLTIVTKPSPHEPNPDGRTRSDEATGSPPPLGPSGRPVVLSTRLDPYGDLASGVVSSNGRTTGCCYVTRGRVHADGARDMNSASLRARDADEVGAEYNIEQYVRRAHDKY